MQLVAQQDFEFFCAKLCTDTWEEGTKNSWSKGVTFKKKYCICDD